MTYRLKKFNVGDLAMVISCRFANDCKVCMLVSQCKTSNCIGRIVSIDRVSPTDIFCRVKFESEAVAVLPTGNLRRLSPLEVLAKADE